MGMTGMRCDNLSYFQRRLPSLASTPTTPPDSSCTYCRTPPALLMTTEEYPGVSEWSLFQMTSPLVLSRAMMALLPPGVQMSLLPSIKGDSV